MVNNKKPLTITELTRHIKTLLEGNIGRINAVGEISNWRPASSGHCYFALKDDKSLIKAVIFKTEFLKLNFKPKEGMKVEIEGYISVYEARGEYQIIIHQMKETGLGELYRRFIELKEKLSKEGLFDTSRKKTIPFLPQKIGVITSPTGAAIKDILNILNRRFSNLEVIIYPVKVQGEGAAEEIAHGINRMNQLNIVEVIIVGRGGGSIEDLWAFNEEIVARAIYDSKIPIISAVGHEIDFTIADFVADLRAPTPSAAAELVISKREDLLKSLENFDNKLLYLLKNKINLLKAHLEKLVKSWGFNRPVDNLRISQQNIDELIQKLERSVKLKLEREKNKFSNITVNLNALNPEGVLKRGYSIVTKKKNNKIIKSPNEVKDGDNIKIQNNGGFYEAIVANPLPLFQETEI